MQETKQLRLRKRIFLTQLKWIIQAFSNGEKVGVCVAESMLKTAFRHIGRKGMSRSHKYFREAVKVLKEINSDYLKQFPSLETQYEKTLRKEALENAKSLVSGLIGNG